MDKGPELQFLVSTILKQHKSITYNYNEKHITLFKKKIISLKYMFVQVSESKSVNLRKGQKGMCVSKLVN